MLGFAVGPDPREAFLPYGHEVRVGLALFGREARGRAPDVEALLPMLVDSGPAEEAATGELLEVPPELEGVRELSLEMGEWSHRAGNLGEEFMEEDGCFTLIAEMRNDRVSDAAAFGLAVAEALSAYRQTTALHQRSNQKGGY